MEEITVLENGDELTVATTQFSKIENLVYYCPECKLYHVRVDHTLDEVEAAISN